MDEENIQQEDEQKPAPPETLRILEALLFASEDVLTPARIKPILPGEPDARAIRKMVDEINIQLQHQRHPFEIVELGGGYQFRTIPYYQLWVQQLFKEKSARKISIQGLECLAIIAYKQPLSKVEIEAIRGVLSDGAMKTLLEKRFITISGRSDKPGRPLLYGTTPEFLKYFGINKLSDLPKIEEFEAIAKEQIDSFSDDQLVKAEAERTEQKDAGVEEGVVDSSIENTVTPEPGHTEQKEAGQEDINDFKTAETPVKAMFELEETKESNVEQSMDLAEPVEMKGEELNIEYRTRNVEYRSEEEWNADHADGADESGSEK